MFTVTSHEIHWAIVVNHNLGINMAQNHIKKKKTAQPSWHGHVLKKEVG